LQNLSTRPIRLKLAVEQTSEGATAVDFDVKPETLLLPRGHTAGVTLRAITASSPTGAEPAEGAVVVRITGGGRIRIPWTIAFGDETDLIGAVHLSAGKFRPSDTSPALLLFQAGTLLQADGRQEVRPVSRIDVDLFNAAGDDLGLLARLRDVLPGRVALGLTGRDPAGGILPPGTYTLRLRAWPTDGGPATRRSIPVTILGS
jgi:hypothetical protein